MQREAWQRRRRRRRRGGNERRGEEAGCVIDQHRASGGSERLFLWSARFLFFLSSSPALSASAVINALQIWKYISQVDSSRATSS